MSHQLVYESQIIPIALDAQYSSSVTPQQAMPIWYISNLSFPHLHRENCAKIQTQCMLCDIRSNAMSQQQINDQVHASNASAHAAIYESMLLTETSIPYWYVFFH